MELKGSRTAANLLAAFAGESQARNRYGFFASAARKEGFRQIEAIFLETADNEREHAKRFYTLLCQGSAGAVTATMSDEAVLGDTAANLRAAANGEQHEHTALYPECARLAEAEGFKEIATAFHQIAKVEQVHEARFRALLANLEAKTVFAKGKPTRWRCRNCGYIHEGPKAPKTCPACLHPQEYYEVAAENW